MRENRKQRVHVVAALSVGWLSIATGPKALGHGESVRGAGGSTINTIGAEIEKGFGVSLRYDRRQYDTFSDQDLLDFRRQRGEDVHQHEREESVFLGLSMAFSEKWELSLLLPYNRFTGFKDNSDEFALENDTISKTSVSEGLGDMLLLGRFALWKNTEHAVAGLTGIKLPTGSVRERTDQADIVGTHNQPGSGSLDFQLGGAYTGHFFAERVGVSADALVRINTEGAHDFRSGNSFQADVALSYNPHGKLVPIFELNFFTQERDIEENEVKKNSGVTSLFTTLGLRYSPWHGHSFFVAGSVPVWQHLPGIQNEESYRVSVGYGFGW